MILLAAYCVIADHRGFTVALLRFGTVTYGYQELKTKRTLDEAYAYGAHHKKHATKQGDKKPYQVWFCSQHEKLRS